MHEISKFTFWIMLVLYVATLVFVTYVGVYLTYVAIPIIVISGLVMTITKPKNESGTGLLSTINELGGAATTVLEEATSFLDEINTSLEKHNRTQLLIIERTKFHRDEIRQLKLKMVEPKINLKYASNEGERQQYKVAIDEIDVSIKELERKILSTKKQCEIEVAKL